MRVADVRVLGITAMRERVKARQAAADEVQDQDSILIYNMLQDRLNELIMIDGDTICVRPREADENSVIRCVSQFVYGVMDLIKWSDPIPGGDYEGMYIEQAQEQLRSDLRELLEAA